jgi:hypothetical protein
LKDYLYVVTGRVYGCCGWGHSESMDIMMAGIDWVIIWVQWMWGWKSMVNLVRCFFTDKVSMKMAPCIMETILLMDYMVWLFYEKKKGLLKIVFEYFNTTSQGGAHLDQLMQIIAWPG